MINARCWSECLAASSASSNPASSFATDHRIIGFHQHGGMAAVAETPAGAGVDRERALMVAAMNGTVRPQPLPILDGIDQIARREEMDHFALPGGL